MKRNCCLKRKLDSWVSILDSLFFHFGRFLHETPFPAGIYLLKVNNRNTRTRCEICSKLTINIPERCDWPRSGVLIVNFEHILHLVLMFLLLTLSRQMLTGDCLITRNVRLPIVNGNFMLCKFVLFKFTLVIN